MTKRDPFEPRWTAFLGQFLGKPIVVRLAAVALLIAGSVAVHAQQAAKVYRIGYVTPSSRSADPSFAAFRQGLRELGYVEGKNVIVEARFAEGLAERLPGLVAELIELKVDVLLAGSPLGAVTAKKASTTVPIVFAGVGDPVSSGIVASLARPGGNITGVASGASVASFGEKWLELLKEAVPGVLQVAVLANRSNTSNSPFLKGIEAAARTLKVKIDILDAGNAAELDRALATIGASKAQGMIVTSDPFLYNTRATIVQFAASKRLPAMYFFKPFAEAGGLMSYGASLEESYRRAATYVDKILKGAKPADLPIEQPTRFELVINMKTARALGLRIPQSLLLRADHVIE
jgi:putative ABC transport system substrate-binding protein